MLESVLIPLLTNFPDWDVKDSASTQIDFNTAAEVGMFPLEYYTNHNNSYRTH